MPTGAANRRFGLLAAVLSASMLLLLPKSHAATLNITTQPQSQSLLAGTNAIFSVSATGQGTLTYQWSLNATNLTDSAHVTGATSANLTISNLAASDAGTYNVVVSDSHNSLTSSNATLTVLFPPTITTQPTDQSTPLYASTTFTVTANGTSPLAYQWQHAGTNLVNDSRIGGATGTTLSISNCSFDDAGAYTVVASNSYGLATSTPATLTIVGQRFTEVTNFASSFSGPLAWADFDNDGKLDLFCGVLLRNLGNGTFTQVPNTGLPSDNAASWGDYDKDGRVDLLLSSSGVFRNLGNGAFTNVAALGTAFSSGAAWGDYDGDGNLDAAVFGYIVQGWTGRIFRNDGHGGFPNINAVLPQLYFANVTWHDYDGDGKADLLVSGLGYNTSASIRKLFHSTNDTVIDTGLSFPGDGSVDWGDFDNDGDPDLLISCSSGNFIYRNDGNGNFTVVTLGLPSSPAGNAIWGDFNNDGYLDVLLMGNAGSTCQLYLNNGGTSFTLMPTTLPAVTGSLRCADFDNDGNLDVALGDSGSGTVRLFHNAITTNNTPPDAPTGLTATITQFSTALALNWEPATDANQSAGLTYNLRIGTRPGASDIFDPMSDATNGFHRIVADGNCGGKTNRVFTNLAAGIYYWSVQAIDHSYAASTFAPEQSFMIAKPTISDITNQSIFPDITTAIPFTVTALGTSVDTLTFSGVASNSVLIPTNGFVVTGTGTNRVLLITPARNQRGSTSVTITVTDTNGATASDSFIVTVQHTFTSTGVSFSGDTAWGDYDNDGFQDVLTFNPPTLYHNNGDGTFTKNSQSFAPFTSAGGAWGDYDNDGYLDLAMIGYTGSGWLTRLFHNNGDGTFTMSDAGLPGLSGGVAWGDYDNDGDLDLVVSGSTTTNNVHIADIYRNDHGTFTAIHAGLPSAAGFSKQPWGDFNRDGRLDLLLGTTICRNNGDGTFTDIGAGIDSVFGGDTSWGDYDNDGYLDVAIIGFNGPGGPDYRETSIYHNNLDGTFTKINSSLVPLSNSDLAWGDFDNDGFLDLAIMGTTNYTGSTWTPTLLYHNNGDGTFSDMPVEFPGMASLGWVDYDNDGALDLIACAPYPLFNTPGLYHNDTPKKDIPPSAPGGLSAQISTNGIVYLNWSAAAATNVTYNLRIGTIPGGIDIISPQSDVTTGRRRITARGNASSTNFWFLQNLPRGTYYWTVQAVDQAFVGSAFSAEAVFTVTNSRPSISSIPPQTVSHSILSQPIPFTVTDLETPAAALIVTATSSNTNLIANDHIYLSGTDTNRQLQLQPATNQTGTVTISVLVIDEGGDTANTNFVVNVTNFPPIISALSNLNLRSSQSVPPVPFQIGDAESSADALHVTVSSSNTNFVANSNLTLSGTSSNRVLQIVPNTNVKGSTTITLSVADPSGAAVSRSFLLRVSDFDQLVAGLPDVAFGAVDCGDYDNDGHLDVLICGMLSNATTITRIYHNNGNGTFTDIQAGLPGIFGQTSSSVSWGDFNNDNLLDVVIAAGQITRLYRNNGDGTFTDTAAALPASLAAAWIDYDNDGRLDLVLARGATPTALYHNLGNGTFTNSGVTLPVATSLAVVDFDNDGRPDVLLGGSTDKQTPAPILMRNNGNGVFSNVITGFLGITSTRFAWGDYDQDGRFDILMSGSSTNNYMVALYHNNISNSFDLVTTNLLGVTAGAIVWGDLDNDGVPDLFVSGVSLDRNKPRSTTLYHNGVGAFIDSGEPLLAEQGTSVALGDFDSDGQLDILYCGTTNGSSTGPSTLLYRNSSGFTNTPPTAPTGLTVLPGPILSWNSSTDAQTTNSAGLTYNLRIGTNTGGCQIMSPQADPSTGVRRVARIGNVGTVTQWRPQLPPGTYYWSVQAIDPAFAGSPFATESSFTIPHQPSHITSGVYNAAGQFTINFDGDAGAPYRVLVSSDLVSWTPLGSATEVTPAKFQFVDNAAASTMHFYQVTSP